MTVPERPKIYHIIHVDRLGSVLERGGLLSDAQVRDTGTVGTNIGMAHIKERRLHTPLSSRPGLNVGDCVPFYFCPKSVMLFLVHLGDHPDLSYNGGQGPILHLQADLRQVVAWAEQNNKRWAFTSTNAGSQSFDDWCDLANLDRIDWSAVQARVWQEPAVKKGKQAEFLLEDFLPWNLVESVTAQNIQTMQQVWETIAGQTHKPTVKTSPAWYY